MFLINRLIRPLIGPLFGLIVLSTSLFGAYIITLLLPLLLFGTAQTWRAVLDRAVSFWMIVPVTLLEHLFGVKFKVTGDSIDMHKPAIVIMNHRTRIDWMYFWVALYKINPWLISTSKIALKEELRKIPGAGFGMAATHFIFMRRQVDEDRRRLTDAIDYYIDMRRNYQILLFPEGTDKSAWTTRKSDEYAKKKGLKQLDYVIYPRVAGFTHLINRMRQR
ncbi:unnamed protein product [Anisakis simplex]|uniref:Lysocardiolipin acyltransferase 1 (inferred by orthology to a human protein) n=1 Tax=Anisakis simplex TaxID=6269 RepID=A0A0M3K0X6_ANISI|nr:unnamed protein product [Anisakis simplex]